MKTKKTIHWHWVILRAVLGAVPYLLMLAGQVGNRMFDWVDHTVPNSVTQTVTSDTRE